MSHYRCRASTLSSRVYPGIQRAERKQYLLTLCRGWISAQGRDDSLRT